MQSKRVLRREAIPERKPPVWHQLAAPIRVETAVALQIRGAIKKACKIGDLRLEKGDKVTEWHSEQVWGTGGSAKEFISWVNKLAAHGPKRNSSS